MNWFIFVLINCLSWLKLVVLMFFELLRVNVMVFGLIYWFENEVIVKRIGY